MDTDKIFAEQLVNEYSQKSASKVVALRKLDRKAKLPANIAAYTIGIVFSLVFGTGLCFAMGILGSNDVVSTAVGIAVGVLGMIGMGANLPLYRHLLKKGREKYAFEIIQLAKEITGD